MADEAAQQVAWRAASDRKDLHALCTWSMLAEDPPQPSWTDRRAA